MSLDYLDKYRNEEKEDEYTKEENIYDKYYNLFSTLKHKKSKKLVNYYQMKILGFNTDYNNPHRKKLIKIVKEMRKPYKDLFKEDII